MQDNFASSEQRGEMFVENIGRKLVYLLQEQYIICCLVLPHSIIERLNTNLATQCAETPGLPPTDQSHRKTSLLSSDSINHKMSRCIVADEKSYFPGFGYMVAKVS